MVPMVAAVVAVASPAIASASVVPHRQLRPAADAVPGSGLTLARAPAGLRAAVRRTLDRPAAAAGSPFQQARLTATDGAANDHFGWSVAVSGSTAVVGAYGKNSNTGAAYVFTRSGSTWSQRAKLPATGVAAGDYFGWSVAVSGSTAVVGAPSTSPNTGAAYVFTGSGSTWTQRAKLTATDAAPGDSFGYAVALSGSTAVVGAPYKNSNTGAVYVFTGSGSTWSQQARLTAADGAAGDDFGLSVALSGSTAVVGAPYNNNYTGAVYVFTGSGSSWSQQAELTPAAVLGGPEFGLSVALSGSTVLVGAPNTRTQVGIGAAYVFTRSGSIWSERAGLLGYTNRFGISVALSGSTALVAAPYNNANTGAVDVFTGSGGTWSQEAELTAADSYVGDQFGISVALSGSTALVGAPSKNSAAGTGYVFVLPSQQAKLTAADGAANDRFGWSVAISGSTAVVGAYGKSSNTGVAYVFIRSGSTWSQRATLTASGGAAGDYFGWSVAVSGSTVVIGAPGANSSTGAAYVFTGSGSTWTQQARLTATGGAPGDRFGYAVALSGSVAVIGATGSNSNTGAAYVFTGSGSTWPQQAKLTAAAAAPGDYFGYAVALSGSTAVVGAPGKNTSTGAAYVFTGSGGTWSQQAELGASDPATTAYFGWSVALSGSTALVGAPGNNNYTGAAYVFTGSGSSWPQQAELTAADARAGDKFGISVAIAGPTAVVGAPLNNAGSGAAYVFTSPDLASSWPQQAKLTAAAAAPGDHFGNSVTLSGSTAAVGAPGKNSNTGTAYVFAGV
jgi:hypothetical protein